MYWIYSCLLPLMQDVMVALTEVMQLLYTIFNEYISIYIKSDLTCMFLHS